jgi:hypothetical protein
MKNFALIVVVTFVFAIGANAQLLLEENFDYPNLEPLTAHGWSVTSAGVAPMTVSSGGGLSYAGYASSGIGNAALVDSNGQDDGKLLASAVTSGTLYFTFLVKVDAVGTTGYFIHLGGSTSAFAARVFGRTSGSGFNFGLSNTSTGTFGSTVFTFGTTYLCVIKYDVSATGACTLWVYSSGIPENESSAGTPELTVSGSGQASIDRVCLRQFNVSQRYTVDGIRLATEWSSAPLPVELTSFIGTVKGTGVELAWKTATEVNNHGFEIERSASGGLHLEGGAHLAWTKIGFVEGHGTTNAPKSYSFVDASAVGTVSYRLKQVDNDGTFEYSNQVEVTVASPAEYALMQNHPNPFNPATSINYTLPASGFVTLKVYDMLGKEVATLVNGMQDAGAKIAKLDASQLPSGIYFYTLRTNTFSATKKMLLVK